MDFHIVNVEEFQPRLLLQQLVRFVFPTALRSAAVVSAILLLLFLYSQRPGREAYKSQPTVYSYQPTIGTVYSYQPSYDSSYGNSYRNYGTCSCSSCRPSDSYHYPMTPTVVPAHEMELSYQADLARTNEFRVIPLGTRRDLLKKLLPTRTRKPTIEPTPAPRLLEYYPTELDQLRNKERGYCTREFDDPSDAQTKIRLLKLLPLAGNYVSSPIKCYFLNARHFTSPMFWDQVKYTALSYTWGPAKEPSDVKDILINDHKVSVRRNLWAFLHTMRGLGIEGPFWIDALCIDQLNMNEKVQQLRLMPKIYAKADSVVVWLGNGTSVSTDLRQLQSSCDKMNILRDKMSRIDKVICLKKKSRDEAGYLSKPFHTSYLDGLRYLVENTYWSRLWILQEIFMAKQLRIYTGDRRWDLQELVRLQREFEPKHPHDIDWSNWNRIVGLKKQGRKLSKMHLHEALHHWSEQQCRGAHDKVYGLLGLVAKPEITIDLSIRIEDLFRQVLRLEQKKIYAKGYAYAESFATQLLASLGLEHGEDARAIKAEFLDAYRE
ncbi:heterokaryon incompatibility protein-domain-containing protein [Paraphoma chrysanthemicola]|uniref:Heterokaryon incompatibility protein-domain-containing protein n=1 Tax=Paraphoma chrysanthemicola TaxID=798071 RepID=A0A8K0R8K6_9PLEO|nr:heterokaryon incompatibility protein-domain-containing protein [Paraphoma chrysanthemicola]